MPTDTLDSDRRAAVAGSRRRGGLWAARIGIGGLAGVLLFLALTLGGPMSGWQVLPDMLVPASRLTLIVTIERFALGLFGIALLLRIPRVDRSIREGKGISPGNQLWLCLAAALALPASEAVLRLALFKPIMSNFNDPPLRRAVPVIGWELVPSRSDRDPRYPSRPAYFIDDHGYRVRAPGENSDTSAPSILFFGESVMFGAGLDWRDTIAGRIEAASGMQSANLSVNAYSTSQSYLRLRRELPKFAQPVAVVFIFAPSLMTRELDRDRPWLDSAGRWHGARKSWQLGHLGRLLFPYHSRAAIDAAVAMDRRILRLVVDAARERGAEPLILVPVFTPHDRERALLSAVFDGAALPHVVVPLDYRWRLYPDHHPDERADRAMADAVWQRLQQSRGTIVTATLGKRR